MKTITLTPTLVRRLAVTRQRLAQPEASPAGILEVLRALGCLQLDPIRTVERSQYLVLWSRLGSYDPAQLDTLLWQERQLFEYWAHAASIVLTENYPLHHLQMRRFTGDHSPRDRRIRDWLAANEPFRRYVLEQLDQDGPLSMAHLEDRSVVPWQSEGWTAGRNLSQMLSFLWERGEIMVAGRKGLHKQWALAERWLPEAMAGTPLPEADIVRQAAQLSLRALGVATARQIENHFIRGCYPGLASALTGLVAAGRVVPARISSAGVTWPGEWYIHAADLPLVERLLDGDWQPRTTLLSPFDNLICDRERTELLWNFHFRIEIYTPAAKRQYGYYVLPILHGEQLVGRVDPRLDRRAGVLHVNAIHLEPAAPVDPATGRAVALAIASLAQFLGAREIRYGDRLPVGWESALREITPGESGQDQFLNHEVSV